MRYGAASISAVAVAATETEAKESATTTIAATTITITIVKIIKECPCHCVLQSASRPPCRLKEKSTSSLVTNAGSILSTVSFNGAEAPHGDECELPLPIQFQFSTTQHITSQLSGRFRQHGVGEWWYCWWCTVIVGVDNDWVNSWKGDVFGLFNQII
jgi:hypothetical protein